MQGLPCSNCSRDMVGHSESQGPVSVSIYAIFCFCINTVVMGLNISHLETGLFWNLRRLFKGNCVLLLFWDVEFSRTAELASFWTPIDDKKGLWYSRKHLHFDLTYEKNLVHIKVTRLWPFSTKAAKFLLDRWRNLIKNSVCFPSWPVFTTNPTGMCNVNECSKWKLCKMQHKRHWTCVLKWKQKLLPDSQRRNIAYVKRQRSTVLSILLRECPAVSNHSMHATVNCWVLHPTLPTLFGLRALHPQGAWVKILSVFPVLLWPAGK